MGRALEATDPDPESAARRETNLNMAIQNFEYVRLRVTDDFPLMAELLVNEAIAFRELGEIQKSVNLFMGAIKYRKDYTKAYLELARVLKEQNRAGEAAKVLETAMQYATDTSAIEKELNKLSAGR